MSVISSIRSFFYPLLAFLPLFVGAQSMQIQLGPDEVAENQVWTISITIQNDQLKSYGSFPEVPGFKKRGTSSQSSTSYVNGQMSSSQSIIMTYTPVRQGVYTLPPFSMKINDKAVNSPGKKIKVGPPAQRQQRDPFDSFFDRSDDFFGRSEPEYVDVKVDAFFAVTTSKNDVYVGEGFSTDVSFFVAEDNPPMQFYNIDTQLASIVKKIKPTNCWEENFDIETIEPVAITIKGKTYYQYKLFQSVFYPLNTEPIKFPTVGLEMIKFKVAKNPTFFGQNRKVDYKTYYSQPKEVKVKELPAHPLKNVVAVGDYQLRERMRNTSLETGQSVAYDFSIYGEGNISSITKPLVAQSSDFEFYEPNVKQDINRSNNRVTGTKTFSYFMIPNEPGSFKLGDYVNWVYFNPRKKQYDTLRSSLDLTIGGESRKNEAIRSNDLGTFYDRIETADNSIHDRDADQWKRWVLNGFIVLAFGTTLFLLIKKTDRHAA